MSFYDRIEPLPKVLKREGTIPYLGNYVSDHNQLGFYYRPFKKGKGEGAYYLNQENVLGTEVYHLIMMNLFALKIYLSIGWNEFIRKFITYWNHEYIHLIGVTEKGINQLRQMGMNV